jgi:inorganic triphosphatase YgiF
VSGDPSLDDGFLEREVKLDVDPRFELPDLRAVGVTVSELEAQVLDATYFDAADGRLLDLGITVRRRTGDGIRWTVKAPTEELAVAGALARREVELVTDDESLPAVLLELLTPFLGGAEVGPVAHLRSRRRRLRLTTPDGAAVAEIDDDEVTARPVAGASATVSFREIEVEFGPESPAALVEGVVAALVAAGARSGEQQSKVDRALRLLGLR